MSLRSPKASSDVRVWVNLLVFRWMRCRVSDDILMLESVMVNLRIWAPFRAGSVKKCVLLEWPVSVFKGHVYACTRQKAVVGSLPEKYGPCSVSVCRWGVSCTHKGHFLVTLRPAVYIGPGCGCWSECGGEPGPLHLYLPSFHHLTPPWPLSEPRSLASLPKVPLVWPIFCHFIDPLISSWVFALFLL